MPKIMKTRGTVILETLAVIAVIGLAIAWFRPSVAKSNAKNVDKTTTALEVSNTTKEGQVSASLEQLFFANSTTADTPEKDFIARDIALIRPLLAPASYEQQLEAEKRRIAVMEGKLDEISKLYKEAYKSNGKLIEENTLAKKDIQDLKNDLYEQAGAAEFMKKIVIVTSVLVVLLGGLFIWVKLQYGTLMSGVREFTTYTRDETTLSNLREAFDKSVKSKLGL